MGQQVAFIVLIILNAMIFFQTLVINSKLDKRMEKLEKLIQEIKEKKAA